MLTLEELKEIYSGFGDSFIIDEEKRNYYHITDETLLDWRTENQLNEQKDFFQNVVLVNNNKSIWHDNYNNPILSNLEGINMNFSLSIAYRNAKPEVYDELEHLYDVALEYDIFDFYTFKNCTHTNSERDRNEMYIGKDSYFDVTWTDYKEGLGLTTTSENKNIQDKANQYLNEHPGIDRTKLNLVVFEFDGMSESIDYYLQLNHLGLKNIFIINLLYFFQINSKIHRTQNISDEVNEFLMQRASV